MKHIKGFALAAVAAMTLAACGGSDDAASDTTAAAEAGADYSSLKVAVVYIGVPDDKGWTYQHEQGILQLEKDLGIEVKRIENIADNADSEKTFEQLASEGYDVIYATSFGYGSPMANVAVKYPDVCFQWATGAKFLLTKDGGGAFADFAALPANLGTYFGAAEEARYLSGIAAGKATKNNKLGYVAAFPIPEVIRGINAFTLGAQSVNPDATVQVTWTKTWFDPTIEKQAAESLLDAGVDVLGQHQDTTAAGVAAEAKGAKWVGYNSDVKEAAPAAWLTAPTWNWGPYYTKTTKAVADGTCRAMSTTAQWQTEWSHLVHSVSQLMQIRNQQSPQRVRKSLLDHLLHSPDQSVTKTEKKFLQQEKKPNSVRFSA